MIKVVNVDSGLFSLVPSMPGAVVRDVRFMVLKKDGKATHLGVVRFLAGVQEMQLCVDGTPEFFNDIDSISKSLGSIVEIRLKQDWLSVKDFQESLFSVHRHHLMGVHRVKENAVYFAIREGLAGLDIQQPQHEPDFYKMVFPSDGSEVVVYHSEHDEWTKVSIIFLGKKLLTLLAKCHFSMPID